MNEDEARRLLRSTYPIPESSTLAWRPWIEHPVAPRPPRRALLAAIIAAVVVVVIALPVGVTLALHQPPLHSTPPGVVSPGATCAIADGVTSAEFDRVSAPKQNFVFPDSVRITSHARIGDLTAALCALQRQVPGVYHCPSEGVPLAYSVRLLAGTVVTSNVTIFASSCPLVYGLGGTGTRLVKDVQTWTLIGDALGIPDATSQTFIGSSTPPPTAVPSPTPAPVLVPEGLSWTGAARGSLTQAYGTCDQPGTNEIVLISTDPNGNVEVDFPSHPPGTVSVTSPSMDDGGLGLHLNHGVGPKSYTLFLAASGTVTYSPNGISGSMNAWLAPQSNVSTSPSIHITGTWQCA